MPSLLSVPAFAACLILLHSQAAASGRPWTRLATTNLELLTSGDAALAAHAVGELESLRLFFRESLPSSATTPARLRIVAFSSEWEFDEFRTNLHSPAYFAGGPDQPTIVLGRLAKESLPSLRHEYVHFALRASGLTLPLWLEEGLAEYYGGVAPARAHSRARLLSAAGAVPLTELTSVDRASPWYVQPALAERFYATSWALADLLLRSAPLSHWVASPPSLSSELEAALQHHIATLRPSPEPAFTAVSIDSAPAPDSDVDLALARVALFANNLPAALARLERASPLDPETLALRGELELRQGRRPAALDAFRQAFRLQTASRRALWQLAVLEQSAPGGDPLPALERLVAADPAFDEARLVLSSHYLRLSRYQDALTQLRAVRSAPPDKAAFFQRALVFAESRAAESRAAAPTPLPTTMISLE